MREGDIAFRRETVLKVVQEHVRDKFYIKESCCFLPCAFANFRIGGRQHTRRDMQEITIGEQHITEPVPEEPGTGARSNSFWSVKPWCIFVSLISYGHTKDRVVSSRIKERDRCIDAQI